MSRFPPANVRCTPGDSLAVEWEVDHFYPDSEDPQVVVIEVPALGWSRPFDPVPPSQDLPFGRDDIAARLHAANPGAADHLENVAVNVGFQWDGGAPLWSTTTIQIFVPSDPQTLVPAPDTSRAPAALIVARYDDYQATLQWVNQADYRKVIVHWRETIQGNGWQRDVGGHDTAARVGPLQPSTEYLFEVRGVSNGLHPSAPATRTWRAPPGPPPMPGEGAFPPGCRIAAVSRTPDRLQLVGVGKDGVARTTAWQAGGDWDAIHANWLWLTIGGQFPPGAPVTAISRYPNQIDLFAIDVNGVVRTCWWYEGQGWSGWKPIGGYFPGGTRVTALSRNPHQIDLFATTTGGVVFTSWWYEGQEWSGIANNWKPIGGFFPGGAPVTALSRTPNQIDLFATTAEGVVHTSWWYEGQEWSGIANNWKPIGGYFPGGAPVTALSRNPHQIDLFATTTGGVVFTSWWYEGQEWSGIANNWKPIGGFFPAGEPIAAVARTPNQIDLFATTAEGVVHTSWWYEGQEWSGVANNWKPIGGYFPGGTSVTAKTRAPNQIDLFATTASGIVHTSWWYEGQEWSGIANNWRPIGG